MFGFFKKSATQAHVVTSAIRMMSQGRHHWFAKVGERNARKLLDSLAADYRNELHSQRELLKDTYPASLLNVANIIQLSELILTDHADQKVLAGLAKELLLVSIEALRGAEEVGVQGIADVLFKKIESVMERYGLDVTDLMFPSL